jgi:hypothetical protein
MPTQAPPTPSPPDPSQARRRVRLDAAVTMSLLLEAALGDEQAAAILAEEQRLLDAIEAQ